MIIISIIIIIILIIIYNYWGIIKIEVSVKPKAEADNTYRDLDYLG